MWRCGRTPPMSTPPAEPGAGGLPIGMGGRAVSLLSGGIDSPVASLDDGQAGRAAGDGPLRLLPLYLASRPSEKVLELARTADCRWCGTADGPRGPLYRDPGGDRAAAARRSYFTLIMRRFMMRIAERLAQAHGLPGHWSPASAWARWPARPWRPWPYQRSDADAARPAAPHRHG